jgi:hypothetical protein
MRDIEQFYNTQIEEMPMNVADLVRALSHLACSSQPSIPLYPTIISARFLSLSSTAVDDRCAKCRALVDCEFPVSECDMSESVAFNREMGGRC